jgi:predicted nucleic-acid-binding Zn-ribbon protein
METMESPPQQYPPCPKCGGTRFVTDGRHFGLEYNEKSNALYCTNCGYVEFYATRDTLEHVNKLRAMREAHEAKQREKEMRRGR